MVAEMRFIRAWIYFDLSKWYGGVPIVKETFSLEQDEFNITRNSYDEVVDYILEQLDLAIPDLKSVSESPKARATREAAMALKGRVLLYSASELFTPGGNSAKWQTAADANKAVMDLSTISLNDDYSSLFKPGSLQEEVIFAIEFASSNNQGGWSGANALLMPSGFQGWSNVVPNNKFINMFEMTNGELPYLSDGTVNTASGFDHQNPYIMRDPRFYDIVLFNGAPFKDRSCEYWLDKDKPEDKPLAGRDSPNAEPGGLVEPWNASPTGYNFKKLIDETQGRLDSEWGSSSLGPDIVFRKTEAYLNYAEAQIALGNEGEARAAINAVRSKASVNMPPVAASITGQYLVAAYRRERAIEFILEDQRFHDIRRWKIAEEVLGKTMYGVSIRRDNSTGEFEFTYNRLAAENRLFLKKQYLLPIPLDEITRTEGSLIQNPGYD